MSNVENDQDPTDEETIPPEGNGLDEDVDPDEEGTGQE